MKELIIIFLFMGGTYTFSQATYDDLDAKYEALHGELSVETIDLRLHFLDSVSKIKLSSGREKFLMDYGTAYGWKYLVSYDESDQLKELEMFTRCWEEFKNEDALFQVMGTYMFIDCDKSLKYCALMEDILFNGKLKREEKRKVFTEQAAGIREFCTK